jgi:Lipase (class 3)
MRASEINSDFGGSWRICRILDPKRASGRTAGCVTWTIQPSTRVRYPSGPQISLAGRMTIITRRQFAAALGRPAAWDLLKSKNLIVELGRGQDGKLPAVAADFAREKGGRAVPFAFDEFNSIVAGFASPISDKGLEKGRSAGQSKVRADEGFKPDAAAFRYACALVAELAYHHVPEFEIDGKKRAMSVPCEQYRAIVVGGTATNVTIYLQDKDLPNFVVVDRGIIAVGILLNKLLFIGFRGTKFLFDWRINLTAPLVEIGPGFLSNGRFLRCFSVGRAHRGFTEEAVRISAKINDAILKSRMKDIDHVFLTGHSLGGAVAALASSLIDPAADSTCIFAAPRYWNVAAYYGLPSGPPPTQIQRPGDIVPYVPPRSLGYADHPCQFSTAGQSIFEPISHSSWPFFLWRIALFLAKTFEPHSMEAYRRELGHAAGAKWANEPLAPYEKLKRADVVSAA